MGKMMSFLKFVVGPELYRIHRSLPSSDQGRNYVLSPLEEHTQKAFNIISTAKSILYYTAPVWTIMLYRRGYMTLSYGTEFLKYSVWFAVLYFGLMFVRGIGRYGNQEYVNFISVLDEAKGGGDVAKKRLFDFEFSHWPVDFKWVDDGKSVDAPPYHLTGRLRKLMEANSVAKLLIHGLPCELLSYLVSHGFGLSMVYPGSTALLNAMLGPALRDGRNKLVEVHNGKRSKLHTKDGNYIDAMFVDRRHDKDDATQVGSNRGNILVIGCEGNAGFYEVGVMITPLEPGYSVLGWNHPGFGASTGSPSPEAEINAIHAVMQFALDRLHFKPENIILFGWSIGAFSAIHATRIYPDIQALFLDATFDDIVPLAQKAMPPAIGGIVKRTMRSYINLHHSEIIKNYSGPVHFVRRAMDEVMNKDGQRVVSSNCGNPLLYKFLLHRFPGLFGATDEERIEIKAALDSWLDREDDILRTNVMTSFGVEDSACEAMLAKYIEKHSPNYPILIGEDLSIEAKQRLVLYLASKHMSHFESTHCTPLPSAVFIQPWDIKKDIQPHCGSEDSSQCSSDDFEIINNKL